MAETTNTVTAAGKRKQRVGEVVSNKMTKTIVVRVERRFPHPKFKKIRGEGRGHRVHRRIAPHLQAEVLEARTSRRARG
jgi:ribosomal protein S17